MEEIDRQELFDLADVINAEHKAFRRAFKATFRSGLMAGDKLLEAKELVGHGGWGSWVAENCEFSDRTAQVYMQLARNRDRVEQILKTAVPADLSITSVLREIAAPETAEIEPAGESEGILDAGVVEAVIVEAEPPKTHQTGAAAPETEDPETHYTLDDVDPRIRDFYTYQYKKVVESRGLEAANAWLSETVRGRKRYLAAQAEALYEKHSASKTEYVARELYHVVRSTTATFDDLPEEESPLPGILDNAEWREVLGIIEGFRAEAAANQVEAFVKAGKDDSLGDLRRDLAYIMEHHEHADEARKASDAALFRQAAENYAALAQGLEEGMKGRHDG